MHYAVGHSFPGYLPEGDVWVVETLDEAKAVLAADMIHAADSFESWADEHDCDDIPCPTYGDDCPWNHAQDLRNEAEQVMTWPTSGNTLVGGLAYWIDDTDEEITPF